MGKFDKYKIDLKGMLEDSFTYEFLLDNLFFTNIDAPEVQKGKVNVNVLVKRTPRAFELNIRTEGVVVVLCDRCIDEMELSITSTDILFVKFGKEFAEENGNVIVIPEDEGGLNLAWFLYEFIALAIPMKHVHAPGKCNKSMMGKLNKHLKTSSDEDQEDSFESQVEETEEVEEEVTDPRWNELKKILDNN